MIFDLDGVITDTAKYHYLAWKKIAEEFKIDFDEKKNEEFKGVSRKTCLEKLLSWGNIQLSDKEFEETLVRKNDYYKELLNNLTSNDILPGIIDSIKLLHEKGIKVSLFSVSKNTDAILERLGIRDVFDEIVCGNDIVNSKPHYEGYLLAADRMKVEPRLCAMVEDSVSGINGAKALSMKTIAVMKENKANADYCIDNTSKLIDVIKNSDYKIVDFVYISSCQRIFKFMFNDTNRHAFLDIFTYDLININENIGRKLRNKYIAKKIFFTAFNPRIRYMFKTGKKVLYDGSIRERDKISECYYSLLDKNYIRYRKKIFKKENSGYQKTIVYDINSCKSLIKPLIAYDRVFPLKAAKFNGVDVFIPNDYDFYLKSTYGDYYSLPISFNNHMGIS